MDAFLGGLLSQSDSFTVHLGTAAVDISPSMPLNGFLDAFYPEYAPALAGRTAGGRSTRCCLRVARLCHLRRA